MISKIKLLNVAFVLDGSKALAVKQPTDIHDKACQDSEAPTINEFTTNIKNNLSIAL